MERTRAKKTPPPAVERAGKRFADDMALAGIGYAAVFVYGGELRGIEYSAADGRVIKAVPVLGSWCEYETVG